MKKILIATGNQHKLTEIRSILNPLQIQVIGADEVNGIPQVEEDAPTFAGNAAKKAIQVAIAKQQYTFADDSGLEVEVLNNQPGIHSARYAGTHGDDQANLQKLLQALQNQTNRKARFVCVIAVSTPKGELIGTARGEVYGKIIHAPQGDNGFGYDPIFIPDGYTQTFAQLDETEKNKISHRYNALKIAIKQKLFATIPQ